MKILQYILVCMLCACNTSSEPVVENQQSSYESPYSRTSSGIAVDGLDQGYLDFFQDTSILVTPEYNQAGFAIRYRAKESSGDCRCVYIFDSPQYEYRLIDGQRYCIAGDQSVTIESLSSDSNFGPSESLVQRIKGMPKQKQISFVHEIHPLLDSSGVVVEYRLRDPWNDSLKFDWIYTPDKVLQRCVRTEKIDGFELTTFHFRPHIYFLLSPEADELLQETIP